MGVISGVSAEIALFWPHGPGGYAGNDSRTVASDQNTAGAGADILAAIENRIGSA